MVYLYLQFNRAPKRRVEMYFQRTVKDTFHRSDSLKTVPCHDTHGVLFEGATVDIENLWNYKFTLTMMDEYITTREIRHPSWCILHRNGMWFAKGECIAIVHNERSAHEGRWLVVDNAPWWMNSALRWMVHHEEQKTKSQKLCIPWHES